MTGECSTRTALILAALAVATTALTIAYLLTRPALDASSVIGPTPTPMSDATTAPTPLLPDGVESVVTAFLDAWSTQDPEARHDGLEETATAELVEQLALTDLVDGPDSCTPTNTPVIADHTTAALLINVATTCEPTVWLGLDQDTQAPYGWRVTGVGRERSWIS